MAKIIQFPARRQVKERNHFEELKSIFAECDTAAGCSFFLESAELLFQNGNITENELYTLRRIGRTRRQELARPEPVKIAVEAPGVYCYTPEMGQERPECQMEASLSHYGDHYYIDTPMELKGRGITFMKKYEAKDFMNGAENRKCGWNEYCVTKLAFKKLKEKYTISMERCLD